MRRCKWAAQLAAYVDNELELPQQEALRQHLEHCAYCAQELERLQQLEALLEQLETPPVPPYLFPATLQRLRQHAHAAPSFRYRYASLGTVLLAAAACFVLVVRISFWMPPAPSQALEPPVFAQAEHVSPAAVAPPTVVRQTEQRRPSVAKPHSPKLAALPPLKGSRIMAGSRTLPQPVPPRGERKAVLMAQRPRQLAISSAPNLEKAESLAEKALEAIRRQYSDQDPELYIAALENIAVKYPATSQAAKALLTAANLQRQRGLISEADHSYQQILRLPSRDSLSKALAHKALAEIRAQTVGEDELTRYHYQQAVQSLNKETAPTAASRQALLAKADLAQKIGLRREAIADYAYLANQNANEPVVARLADVL